MYLRPASVLDAATFRRPAARSTSRHRSAHNLLDAQAGEHERRHDRLPWDMASVLAGLAIELARRSQERLDLLGTV